MTEKEVLEKLDFFKQAIQKLKEERDFWKEQAEENPQEVCETEGWIEAWKTLNEERLKDSEEIGNLREQLEKVRNDFTNADLECDRLKAEIEKADSAYAKLAHMYNERKPDPQKKYSEEDLKKLLKKASERAKKDMNALMETNEQLTTRCENLEITNRDLERELQEKNVREDIDKVLEGEITEKEIDEILTKPTRVVKLNV